MSDLKTANMKKSALMILVIAFHFFYSCQEDKEEKTRNISRFNLENAQFLFMSKQNLNKNANVNSSSYDDQQGIFKITAEGKLEKVEGVDEFGNTIVNTMEPVAIIDSKAGFVFIGFEDKTGGSNYNFLVNSKTGKAYEIEEIPQQKENRNNFRVQSDNKKNIYFVKHTERAFFKMDTSNPDQLSVTEISDPTAAINFWQVNNDGVLAYNGKVRFQSGGFKYLQCELAGGNPDLNYNLFASPDRNDFHYIPHPASCQIPNVSAYFRKATVDGTNITESVLDANELPSFNNFYRFSSKYVLIDETHNYKFIVVESGSSPVKIFDLKVLSNNLNKIRKGVVNSSSIFYSAMNTLNQPYMLKVNIAGSTPVVTTIIQPNKYDIYDFSATDSGDLTFYALDMSNGKKVVGKLSSSGAINILSETNNLVSNILPIN